MYLVDTFAAPFLLGTFLNVFLAGINWMQIITYFNTIRPEEKAIYKWVVSIVGLIGACHTCFNVVGVYKNLVQNYDTPMNLLIIHWSYVLDPVTTAVVAAIVQASLFLGARSILTGAQRPGNELTKAQACTGSNLQTFYAYRIYILSNRSIPLPLLVVFLTLVQLGVGCFTTGFAFKHATWPVVGARISWAVSTWLFMMAGTDLLITVTIVFLLVRRRSDFTGTNSIIDNVIRYTVTNNGLTAAAAICSSIMFQADPGLWHVVPGTIIIKLYGISLMASLNSRKNLAHDLALSRTGGPGPTLARGGGSPKHLLHLPGVNGVNHLASISCQNRQSGLRNPSSLHFKDTPLRHVANLIGVGNGSLGGSASRATSMRSMRSSGSDHHGENSFPVQVTIDTTLTEFQVEEMDWEEKERKKVSKSEEDRTNCQDGAIRAKASMPIAPVPTVELTNPPFRIYVEEPNHASSGLEIETSQSDLLSKG